MEPTAAAPYDEQMAISIENLRVMLQTEDIDLVI